MKYPQPPFVRDLDLSKPGVVFEQSFRVPANREWAPQKLEFGQAHTNYKVKLRFTDTVPGRLEREVEEASQLWRKNGYDNKVYSHVTLWRVIGIEARRDPMTVVQERMYLPSLEVQAAPILLRFTLTPLSDVSETMGYRLGLHAVSHLLTKLPSGQGIDVELDLSKYGAECCAGRTRGKELLSLVPLQVNGDYHMRIENLNPVSLPKGIQAELVMELGRSKT